MTANGGMFLLVVSLKQMAGDFDWPRTVPSLAYAFFFAGTGVGGIAMGYWFDRSGAGPVTLLGLTMIGTDTHRLGEHNHPGGRPECALELREPARLGPCLWRPRRRFEARWPRPRPRRSRSFRRASADQAASTFGMISSANILV